MIELAVFSYLFGVLGTFSLWRHAVHIDPDAMPGGGAWAMLMVSLLWPLVVVLVMVGVVVHGINEAL